MSTTSRRAAFPAIAPAVDHAADQAAQRERGEQQAGRGRRAVRLGERRHGHLHDPDRRAEGDVDGEQRAHARRHERAEPAHGVRDAAPRRDRRSPRTPALRRRRRGRHGHRHRGRGQRRRSPPPARARSPPPPRTRSSPGRTRPPADSAPVTSMPHSERIAPGSCGSEPATESAQTTSTHEGRVAGARRPPARPTREVRPAARPAGPPAARAGPSSAPARQRRTRWPARTRQPATRRAERAGRCRARAAGSPARTCRWAATRRRRPAPVPACGNQRNVRRAARAGARCIARPSGRPAGGRAAAASRSRRRGR